MYIEKTKKQFNSFDLTDEDDIKSYNQLINDPSIRILDKKYGKSKESSNEGDYSSETETDYLYVEYEECSL